MSRRTARDFAFKLIFEIPFFGYEKAEERIDFHFGYDDLPLTESDDKYIRAVVEKCFADIDGIDEKISSALSNWRIERLSKVDLALLRLAATEILYIDDVPYKVAVNEAVELAKQYGDDSTPSFINGVLSAFENAV